MIRLSKPQILLLHEQLLEATGGSSGLRDEGMLDSALNAPFQTFGGEDVYPSIQQKAARLCFGLVKKHPFVDFLPGYWSGYSLTKPKAKPSHPKWGGFCCASGRGFVSTPCRTYGVQPGHGRTSRSGGSPVSGVPHRTVPPREDRSV